MSKRKFASNNETAASSSKFSLKVTTAFVVIITLIIVAFGGRGYKSTVKQYINATMEGDAKKIVSLMPKEYVEASIEYGEYDSKAEIINDLDAALEDSIDTYREYFGKHWKYSYKIEEIYKYSSAEMDRYLYYNDYADISEKVDAIMEVSFSLTISGSGDQGSTTATLILFKIGSKWYIA